MCLGLLRRREPVWRDEKDRMRRDDSKKKLLYGDASFFYELWFISFHSTILLYSPSSILYPVIITHMIDYLFVLCFYVV